MTSVKLKPQSGPSAWIRCLRASRSYLGFCTATTSNLVDDLGYGQQGVEVALGRIVLGGLPLLGEAAEGAYVPGGDR